MFFWKRLILPAICLLAAPLLLVRMNSGIWDPWEMVRTHLARQIAGRARVLVVEDGTTLLNRLTETYGTTHFFVSPEPESALPAVQVAPHRQARVLNKAKTRLSREVFHGIVVDATVLSSRPEASVSFLDTVREQAPGVPVAIVSGGPNECRSLVKKLEAAMVAQAVDLLKTEYRLLPPDTDTSVISAERAGSFPFILQAECVDGTAQGLDELMNSLAMVKWTRVQYKGYVEPPTKAHSQPEKRTFSAPPLDYWLTAASYKAFGFSETSSRLPFALMGLVTVLVFAFGVRRLTDEGTAALATLVLIATPLFLGQCRVMSGEISYTLFLSTGVLAFASIVKRGFSPITLGLLILASLLLFLAKGLFGFSALLLITIAYVVVGRDLRFRESILPNLLLAGIFVVLVLLVEIPREWTFFTHFKFMNRPYLGGPEAEMRTFDFFIRHVAFAALPWTIILPFALARLVPVREDSQEMLRSRRLEVLTLLWFAVPFVLHSALLADFVHTIFPGVGAGALAVALMWQEGGVEQRVNRFQAVVIAGIAVVLLADLFNSPEPLFSYLTADGQFGGKAGRKFPADYSLFWPGKALLVLVCFAFFYYYVQGGRIYRTVIEFFRRRTPFWAALWFMAILLVIRLVGGLGVRYVMAFSSKEGSNLSPEVRQFFVDVLQRRPETIALYGSIASCGLFFLLRYTPAGPKLAKALRFLTPVGRGLGFLFRLVGRDAVGLGGALLLSLAAVVDLLLTFDFPHGGLGRVASSMPFLLSLCLAPVVLGVVVAVKGILRVRGRQLPWSTVLRIGAGALVLSLLGITCAMFRQTRLGAVDIWVLFMGAFGLLGLYSLQRAGDRPKAFHLLCWGVLLSAIVLLVAPMAMRWPGVEAVAFPHSQTNFLRYLFFESRLTWLPVAGAVAFVLVYFFPRLAGLVRLSKRLDRLATRAGGWNPLRWPEQLDARRVFIPVSLVLTMSFAGLYGVQVLPSFSREVSQKHIVELYFNAEGRTDLGDNIFKYREDRGTSGDDTNFYTAQIPALMSQTDLTKVLLADRNEVVRVTRSSSHPGPDTVQIKGFDPEKDDPASRQRYYVVLSQEAFSTANFDFRSKSKGRHIPVLDASNVNFLLAASYLKEGEVNHNRFQNATIDPDMFLRLKEWSNSPLDRLPEEFGLDPGLASFGRLQGGFVNFDDQIMFEGYQMKRTLLARNQKINLRLFFKCTGKISTSWKIFIHMDSTSASNRIHGDHWPLNLSNDPEEKACVGCWRTNHWMVGDIILDDYSTDVPLGSPSGIYNIYFGFYTPQSDRRLKVKDYDHNKVKHDGKNRVLIGTFEVH